jgi:aminopeptidase N
VRNRVSGLEPALIAALVALTAPVIAEAEKPFDFKMTPGKLPKDVRPLAYRIDLVTDLAALKFSGAEEVDLTVAKPGATITLNANGLVFESVALKGEDGAKAAVSIDAKTETATFTFPHPLAAGRHTLAIAYSGPIIPQPAGLYYNDYVTQAGDRKRMLTTQFEATDARRMFPGWDEPAFKANFTLSATVPASYRAISNMPVARETPAGAGLKKVDFATTPKMSSYLVVLVAAEMDRINQSVDGTDIGVDAVAGKGEQGRYALQVATQILPYYNDYFGVKYPLPKLDLIAIPGNYAAGAMENWGGITYIDNALLFDPKTSSEATRQSVYLVTAHEMAHQWSGDLVTMAWWDNLWLNEGFASWMESKAEDHFNPDWKVWLRAHADVERAMALDSRRTTHPIQQAVHDESEAESAFDAITYLKGQSFLRMIETYLGPDAFRDGMRRYMAAHAYSNATTADFWAAMEKASGKPVGKIAAGFTEQPGIPLVKVEVACQSGQTVATLSQGRFTIHDPDAEPLTWQVPVRIGLADGATPQTVLLGTAPLAVKFPGCGKPVKANVGDVGYYRVRYDDANFAALAAAYATLPAADRVNLLGDSWAMVEAGLAPAQRYLDLTRKLGAEDELVVWTQVIASLRQIDDLERGAAERPAFRAYARGLLQPVLARLGWDSKPGDAPDMVLLRSTVIRALGRFDDPAIIGEAKRRFDAFVADPASLPPSLQDAVLIVAGYHADRQTYDALRKLGQAAPSTETRLRYYGALAGSGDPALIAETVDITQTDEISNGRVNAFIAGAAGSSDNPELVWKLFLPKRKAVLDKLAAEQQDRLMPAIAAATSEPAIAAELQSLAETTADSGARRETGKAVEEIGFKADLRGRLLPAVSSWLGAGATH